MNKTRLGIIGAAAIALPVVAPAVALADSGPADDLPTFTSVWESWNEGGSQVGGALVSSAVIGVPDLVLSLPELLVGPGAPKDVTFSGEETTEPIEPAGSSH
jgi:hypothetical protein